MLRSMTGFGRGTYEEEDFSIVIEIKTVNHRYTEPSIRMPRFLNSLEDRIRKTILASVARGRIDVFITASYTSEDAVQVRVDKPLARSYHQALLEIGSAIGVTAPVFNDQAEILSLSRVPDVVQTVDGPFDEERWWPKVKIALDQAVSSLVKMREDEGRNIEGDFFHRLDLIEEDVDRIEARAPQVVREYETRLLARLKDRLAELRPETGVDIDPERVLQEVAIFADRVSITEEIVRLKSHIRQFRTFLQSGEPVGRKLDFLIQEFNREANTIASKANDFELAKTVVEIKAEIEKIREQIQNIE
ncbi:MAG: YicC/YloC family endoribonuclease [Succiniclasticum sp.]|nr:YicC/YloC family endoribonuclease [Succiniclasticum sp.]MDY6346393.1 YicC/YloC family endoribonuclease [Succiniclasticum sp.]